MKFFIAVVTLVAVALLLSYGNQLPGQNDKPMPYPSIEPGRADAAPLVKETQVYPSIDRKIIMSSYITLEVEDFLKAYDDVTKAVAKFKGFIADSHSYTTDSGQKRGTVVIRLPQEEFLPAIKELERLGHVKAKRITGNDVTEEYVDLEARLTNLERQENRLLEILAKANTVEEILKVENQLERVRGEIERITGRLRYLDDRIELATITIEFYEPEPLKPPKNSLGFNDALRKSMRNFVDTTNAIIVALGTIMPVALIAAAGYLAYRLKSNKMTTPGGGC